MLADEIKTKLTKHEHENTDLSNSIDPNPC